jgi:formamidopyrimidine-DNA glycosylase
MPELPDVETYKRYLDATSLHKKIRRAEVTDSRILQGVSARRLAGELKGRRLGPSRRHGKYLFVRFAPSRWLVLHFGMTGDLSYYKEGRDAPEHARLVLAFSNGYRLAYISQRLLGKVALAGDPGEYIEGKGLGPDALALDLRGFREALGKRAGAKSALMNQRRIAGIGNVYSDEVLYLAGVHPRKAAGSLTGEQTRELHRAMRHVLETAVRKKADPERMPRGWLLHLRGVEGGKCPRCGGQIRSVKAAGRTAWYCPSHQRP